MGAVLSAVVLGASGCGGDDDAEPACVILVNGNKLCGADARAYCERFPPASGDLESRLACRQIGAPIPADRADARRRQLAQEEARDARALDSERATDTERGAPFRATVLAALEGTFDPDSPPRVLLDENDFLTVEPRRPREADMEQLCRAVGPEAPRERILIADGSQGVATEIGNATVGRCEGTRLLWFGSVR